MRLAYAPSKSAMPLYRWVGVSAGGRNTRRRHPGPVQCAALARAGRRAGVLAARWGINVPDELESIVPAVPEEDDDRDGDLA